MVTIVFIGLLAAGGAMLANRNGEAAAMPEPIAAPKAVVAKPDTVKTKPLPLPLLSGKVDRRYDSFEVMHADQIRHFRSTPGFGMSRMLMLPASMEFTLCDETFFVPRPELLALEGQPTAYRSRMGSVTLGDLTNRLARAQLKTRQLTITEISAIGKLGAGQDWVLADEIYADGTGEIIGRRAVGALRAEVECARCHNCAEGTLLGAFSYALIPRSEYRPGNLFQTFMTQLGTNEIRLN